MVGSSVSCDIDNTRCDYIIYMVDKLPLLRMRRVTSMFEGGAHCLAVCVALPLLRSAYRSLLIHEVSLIQLLQPPLGVLGVEHEVVE